MTRCAIGRKVDIVMQSGFARTSSQEIKPMQNTQHKSELTYSNPRMRATIPNWPSGSKRVTAHFEIEQHPTRGERAVRTTTGDPKKLTFAKMARIVDGSDGRTYIAEYSFYGFISIMRGDMKFQQETIFERDPRYAATLELFAGDSEAAEKAEEVRLDWAQR